MSNEHYLKIWPEFFEAILSGERTFHICADDGNEPFRVGDFLILQEWLPKDRKYTGRDLPVKVTYILSGIGLQPGFVAMAIAAEAAKETA